MALAQFPELKKLPKRRKLELAEELWCAAINDAAPVTSKQKAVLDSRWKAYRAGSAQRITLDELERRLGRK